jgi:hypothetical protein
MVRPVAVLHDPDGKLPAGEQVRPLGPHPRQRLAGDGQRDAEVADEAVGPRPAAEQELGRPVGGLGRADGVPGTVRLPVEHRLAAMQLRPAPQRQLGVPGHRPLRQHEAGHVVVQHADVVRQPELREPSHRLGRVEQLVRQVVLADRPQAALEDLGPRAARSSARR